jgi:DNA-binding winged helix-turn-helix (wHTH) protein/tetratricopeptide (TPR) repeat protein
MRTAKDAANDVELDLGRYELRRLGRRVKIEKKPMELLILLVRRREQLVSRDEIVRKLWRSDLFIDAERNVNNIVRKIRTALGDHPTKPRFLETVVGKGYRFIGPVRVIDPQYAAADSGPAAAGRSESTADLSERSSLAVLPLMLLGKVADHDGLSLGFSETMVSRLGNLKNVDVLPTSAVMNLPLETPAAEIASRLGVRFVVHGAIQTSKGQERMSLAMFDSHLRRSCWRRQYDIDPSRAPGLEIEIAKQIAGALNRPLEPVLVERRGRSTRDHIAYAEFVRGYGLSASGNPAHLETAAQHLTNAVSRDPNFALAHATLSIACTTRHFEFDPASAWLERAEFHCSRALDIDPDLPEGHVARAFLLWGPSRNFQHLEAIAELKRAIALQANLPHAYNRLGTILAHIGLLDHAREVFERGRHFHPRKAVNPSVVQVHVWTQQYELAREQIQAWRAENPANKYAICYAPQPALWSGNWSEAESLLKEGLELLPAEPLMISLQGMFFALTGQKDLAADCIVKACANPKSFGHAHHTYYNIACILALLGQRGPAFEWLERSVSSGFACWPFFLKDPCLENLRGLSEFGLLVSSLQAKYPDHLGLL